MRRTLLLLLIALLASTVACDSSSPTAPPIPDGFNVSIRCNVSDQVVVSCSSTVTGGRAPIFYRWQADFQDEKTGRDLTSATFNYEDLCNGRDEAFRPEVRLDIRDADDKTEFDDTVVKVCET